MIPKDWQIKKLGDLTKIITSGSRNWAQYYSNSGSKFMRMTNLSRDGINLKLDDLRYVNLNNFSSDGKRTALQAGDILISITAELGKIGLVPKSFGDAYINQHLALVRLNQTLVSPIFIAYLLSSKRMNIAIQNLNDAGAKAGLNLPTLKSIPLLIPPLPEQKKIAQILATWDKAIATTEKLLANSQLQKKALMQQLLTGENRFKNFSGVWQKRRLNQICKIIKGKQLNRDTLSDEGAYPVINGGITPSGYTDKFNVNSNTIAISEGGNSCGFVSLVRTNFWSGGHCYTLSEVKINNDFLYQFLKFSQSKLMSLRVGSGLPNIQKGDVEEFNIIFPSIEEQSKIASFLSFIDASILALKQSLGCLKLQKKALMQQLLTGKRRVKIQEKKSSLEAVHHAKSV
jgi:type I restriction enzyme S subunit